jgi:hypothetical protein
MRQSVFHRPELQCNRRALHDKGMRTSMAVPAFFSAPPLVDFTLRVPPEPISR